MTTILTPGEHRRTLHVDDRERDYLVYIPAKTPCCGTVSDQATSAPMPAVLAFHGATSNARLMRSFCGLSEKAEQAGFVAVYPNGTGHTANVLSWNGGTCCGYAKYYNVDDVAYVRALLADLATIVNIDPVRIYAAGMSNGAMLAYRLAAECADRFAAIAAVAGPMGIDDPRPSRPVPVLHIHGTDDLFAPYEGGVGRRSAFGTPFRSVPDTISEWVRVNGCDPTPTVIEEPPTIDDGTRLVRHVYRGLAEVVLITVEGGGHTWPGRAAFPELLGTSTGNLNANDAIWEFFLRHRL